MFGERSVNYAKTLKVIGTLLIVVGSLADAKAYLQRSLAIFEQKGMLKMVKEVKNKIKMAQSGNKQQILMEAQREFGEPKGSGNMAGDAGAGSDVEFNQVEDAQFGRATGTTGTNALEDRNGSLMQKR